MAIGLALALVPLVTGEALVRVVAGPARVNDYLVADPELGFRCPTVRYSCRDELGAFPYVTNSLGFRGPELPAAGSARGAAGRVLLLGDSFLHAWRVREEDWVGTTVREALAAAGRQAEVYSLDSDDYGTGQELLALRAYGARVQPDHVVLLMFPTNDLLNNTLELAGHSPISACDYFRPYLVPDEGGRLAVRYVHPWRNRLRSSRLFRGFELRWLASQGLDRVRAALTGEPILTQNERLAAGRLPDEYQELFRPARPGSRWEIAWQRTEALVLATRDEAERLGARFTAVVIPEVHQVLRTLAEIVLEQQFARAGWAHPEAVLDRELPERRLEQFFHRAGIAHVQLLGPLRRRAAEVGSAVYLEDGHMAGDGHRTMGGLIAAHLAEGGRDVCFEGGSAPTDPLPLLGEPPIVLDLARRQHWDLFSWGWSDWTSPFATVGPPGWGLVGQGLLLARTGFVTLEGLVTDWARLPVTLTVEPQGAGGRVYARQALAAPGPFRIVFELAPGPDGKPWVPLSLSLAGSGREQPRATQLVLQGLRFERDPPPDWKPDPIAAPRHPRAWLAARLVRLMLKLPVQLSAHAAWRFVPRPR